MAVGRRDHSEDADMHSRSDQGLDRKKSVISFRVPQDEFEALEGSARAAHESVSDYVRQALRFRQSPRFPVSIQATTGGANFTFYVAPGSILSPQVNEARGTLAVDYEVNPVQRSLPLPTGASDAHELCIPDAQLL
jgi:hypothetical protein